ncbi:MAG: ABC transporter permease [Bryobacteraceae bacterium]|jgi:lipopolysaccharide transport system permease protein
MHLPGRHFARNLIYRRTLLLQMVRRDFEQRFIGSTAGWMWGLILPLVQLASWVFVFEVCLHQKVPPGQPTSSYPLFLFCGYLPWLLFQDTVTRSANSMIDNANLITKTVFPAEIVPVSIFLSSLASHLMVVALMITGIGVVEGHFSMWMLMLPVYMVLVGLFAIGVGWIAASLQVYLRDTAQVLTVILLFWFWVTPIFFTEQQMPPGVRLILHLNPLAFVVQAYRDRLLSYRIPSLHDLAIVTVYAVTAFIVGGLFFRHLKRGFADVL